MKKLLLILLTFGLIITGCGIKKEEMKEEPIVTGGWETVLTDKQVGLNEDKIKMFNNAKENYEDLELEPLAVIGKQVVAGKNYMFLAKGYKEGEQAVATYKIVIIYKDLEGNVEITSVSTLDYIKYVSENIENNSEELTGGWYVDVPDTINTLDDKNLQSIFEKATEKVTGITYSPIAVIGKQVVAGTNYAVLCYGKKDDNKAIYLLTIYEDLDSNIELSTQAYIDLAEFNK